MSLLDREYNMESYDSSTSNGDTTMSNADDGGTDFVSARDSPEVGEDQKETFSISDFEDWTHDNFSNHNSDSDHSISSSDTEEHRNEKNIFRGFSEQEKRFQNRKSQGDISVSEEIMFKKSQNDHEQLRQGLITRRATSARKRIREINRSIRSGEACDQSILDKKKHEQDFIDRYNAMRERAKARQSRIEDYRSQRVGLDMVKDAAKRNINRDRASSNRPKKPSKIDRRKYYGRSRWSPQPSVNTRSSDESNKSPLNIRGVIEEFKKAGENNLPLDGQDIDEQVFEDYKNFIASIPDLGKGKAKESLKDLNDLKWAAKRLRRSVTVPSEIGEGLWPFRGLNVPLKSYQVVGVAGLQEREKARSEPHGGIFAYEMGLGKTIMMLANILFDQSKGKKPQTTLIVAKKTIAEQWYGEIKKYCDKKYVGNVMLYVNKKGIISNGDTDILLSQKIVITTYEIIRSSLPNYNPPPHLTEERQLEKWWIAELSDRSGPFHRARFLRVVLDEAQAIKSYSSQTSIACQTLKAQYRWAISGTPVLNKPTELYSYYKFLKAPNTGSLNDFRQNYGNDSHYKYRLRLQTSTSRFMLRRTKRDTFLGRDIIDLPKTSVHTFYVEFSPLERKIYDLIFNRCQARLIWDSENGNLNKGRILGMTTTLKQLIGHYLTIQEGVEDLEQEDFEELDKFVKDQNENSNPLSYVSEILRLRSDLQKKARHPEDLKSDCYAVTSTGRFYGRHVDFGDFLKRVRLNCNRTQECEDEEAICCACRYMPDKPLVLPCKHIFCEQCLKQTADESRYASKCCECDMPLSVALLDSYGRLQIERAGIVPKKASEGPRNKKISQESNWMNVEGILPASAKTLAVKAQILNWIEEDPATKIIIFVQYQKLMRILKRMCKTETWEYAEIHGSVTGNKRTEQLNSFAKSKSQNILLASIDCGGFGLNIIEASRMMILDLWWNEGHELQALSRMYRIGQTKETCLVRICVKDTLDERILQVQEDKSQLIGDIIENNEIERQSIEGLLSLFNLTKVPGTNEVKPYKIVKDEIIPDDVIRGDEIGDGNAEIDGLTEDDYA